MKSNLKFLLIGIIFLVFGFGFNQWTLIKLLPFFALKLTLPREILLAIFNIFFSGSGVLFIVFKNNGKKLLFSGILFLFSFSILFIGGEILVRLFSSTYKYYPTISPANPYKFGPPSGRIFKPNYQGVYKSKEFEVYLKVNSQGFRSGQEFITGNQETKTIAVLGDSMVAAQEVGEEETFVKLLESKTADMGIKQVQNYGMPGTGIVYYLQTYQYYVKKHNPRLVLISIFYNDFQEFGDFSPFWAYGLLDGIDIFLIGRSALYKFAYLQYEQNKLEVKQTFPKDGYVYERPWNDDFEKAYQHFSENLSQLIREIDKDEAIPVIVLMPSLIESSDAVWQKLENGYNFIGGKNTLDRDRIRDELKVFTDKMNVVFIDPSDAFREDNNSGKVLYYPYNHHLTSAGHQLLTEIILTKISEVLKSNY